MAVLGIQIKIISCHATPRLAATDCIVPAKPVVSAHPPAIMTTHFTRAIAAFMGRATIDIVITSMPAVAVAPRLVSHGTSGLAGMAVEPLLAVLDLPPAAWGVPRAVVTRTTA